MTSPGQDPLTLGFGAGKTQRVIPAPVAATIARALQASLSLASYYESLPAAQRDIAEIGVALTWLRREDEALEKLAPVK